MLRKCRALSIIALVAVAFLLTVSRPAMSAATMEIPPAPKVSTFAPADDLARQAGQYLKALNASVAGTEDYKDVQEKIAKDANTLIVIALALGLHDQESKYKPQAGAMIRAAQAVAATKDYQLAKKAIADLQAAAKGRSQTTAELKWEKVASLPELMKQVPLINTKLKRYVKPAKFEKKARDAAGMVAVIAAIAQGSMANASDTKKPGETKQWYAFAAAMRDNAGAVGGAIRQRDEPAAAKAMKKLQQSCEDCHAIFHPEANGKAKAADTDDEK